MTQDAESLKKAFKAWSHIRVETMEDLGKIGCVAYPNYVEWVKKRAEYNKFPIPREEPLYVRNLEIPIFLTMGRFLKTKNVKEKLHEEKEDLIVQLYDVNQEKLALRHKLKKRGKWSRRGVKS